MKAILHYIRGETDDFDFRQRMFNVSSFTFGICFFLTGICNWIFSSFGTHFLISSILACAIFWFLFYLSRIKKICFPWVFVALTLVIGCFFWFITDGWRGAMPIATSLGFVVCLTIVPNKQNMLTVIFLIFLLVLGISEKIFPQLIVHYSDEQTHFSDVWITLIVTVLFISFAFQGFVRIYSEERRKLNEKNKELQKMQKQLVQSEKLASLGQFTSGIAHEINNPLNFVTSGLSIIEDSALQITQLLSMYKALEKLHPEIVNSEEMKQIVAFQEQEGIEEILNELPQTLIDIANGEMRIRRIVEGLQHFSNSNSEQAEKIDINQAIKIIVSLYEVRLHGVDLELKLNPNLQTCQGSRRQIKQVIMGLLENAIDALTSEKRISITTENAHNEILIKISDTGIGIDEESLSKLFDPFYSTKPIGKGTGLGLSISYGIVQQHNGRIEVESELGKGSSVTVYLPTNE